MSFKEVIPSNRPNLPFSQAVISEGRIVHISGQGPLTEGRYVPGTIQEETRHTLENLEAALKLAGSSREHVLRCGIFLAELDDCAGMNEAYMEFFAEPRPARTTVGSPLLAGIKVEIDCVAVVPE